MTDRLPPLFLRKNEDRRLRAGHAWVYSNEVDTARSPMTEFEPGQLVDVVSHIGKWIGRGYVNPHPLISARILTRLKRDQIDDEFIHRRIEQALDMRNALFAAPFYRLAFAESDALSGLIIDRYGDVVVIQCNTAGMDRLKPLVVQALQKLLKPAAIVERSDSHARGLENLEASSGVIDGTLPDSVEIVENDTRFHVDVVNGQKTGWFYDQRDNRAALARIASGQKILDVCSYTGSWGVTALKHGATSVTAIDSSADALKMAKDNASLNDVADRLETIEADAFDGLRDLKKSNRKFDVVVLDPPAFIRRKKATREGLSAYQRLNTAALSLIVPGGLVVSCSCSYHASRDDMVNVLRKSSLDSDRSLQIIREGSQSADHPVHPAMIETRYLKSLTALVLDRR